MKLGKYLYPAVNVVIRVLLFAIVTCICLQSMFSTSFIGYVVREDGQKQEKTLNIADQPWKHLLILAVFVVVCVLAHRIFGRFAGNGLRRERAFRLLAALTFCLGTVWVLITQLEPGSDPSKIYHVAMQWRQHDFSSYAEGGYMFRYPFQAGIVLFYYLLSFVFGAGNYVGVQLVNVAALTVIYLCLAKLAALFWSEDGSVPVLAYAALILWPPLAFFVTYLYGILPGMALSLTAVYCAARYLGTGKYRYILPAVLCMSMATVLKMNCLIYLIAISCFLLYDAAAVLLSGEKERIRRAAASAVFVLLLILGTACSSRACEKYVERLSGYSAPAGETMLSWVVMGLSDAPFGPGSYNGYIGDVFIKYEYDTEKINAAAKADIGKIVRRMSEDFLGDCYCFFARKNAFQWNDPTFICLECTRNRRSQIDVPDAVQSLIDGSGSVKFYLVMNYAQTLILFGVLFYLVLNRKSRNIGELMGAVIFLGGYLFHFVWESGASYTLPYFVIILPYAVKGYADLTRGIDGRLAAVRRSEARRQTIAGIFHRLCWPAAGVLVFALLVGLCSDRNLFRDSIALDDGEDAARQFYHRGDEKAGPSLIETLASFGGGYGYLVPKLEQDAALSEADGSVTLASVPAQAADRAQADQPRFVSDIEDIEHMVAVRRGEDGDGVTIRFRSSEQVLAVDPEQETPRLVSCLDDDNNMFYEPSDLSWEWKVSAADEGGFYITLGERALTYREGGVTLEELTWGDEQIWLLRQ